MRQGPFVFATRTGTKLAQRNLLREFHALMPTRSLVEFDGWGGSTFE